MQISACIACRNLCKSNELFSNLAGRHFFFFFFSFANETYMFIHPSSAYSFYISSIAEKLLVLRKCARLSPVKIRLFCSPIKDYVEVP